MKRRLLNYFSPHRLASHRFYFWAHTDSTDSTDLSSRNFNPLNLLNLCEAKCGGVRCGGLGEAGGGEGEERDADVGDVAQAFGTTEQRGTCGDHIVDNHHMLACERFICFGD